MSTKKSRLLIYKISGLFVNTLTADGKSSFFNRNTLTQPIQMKLSMKKKCSKKKNVDFSKFFHSRLIFENFLKKVNLIAYVLTNLWTPESAVRKMPKKSRLR